MTRLTQAFDERGLGAGALEVVAHAELALVLDAQLFLIHFFHDRADISLPQLLFSVQLRQLDGRPFVRCERPLLLLLCFVDQVVQLGLK